MPLWLWTAFEKISPRTKSPLCVLLQISLGSEAEEEGGNFIVACFIPFCRPPLPPTASVLIVHLHPTSAYLLPSSFPSVVCQSVEPKSSAATSKSRQGKGGSSATWHGTHYTPELNRRRRGRAFLTYAYLWSRAERTGWLFRARAMVFLGRSVGRGEEGAARLGLHSLARHPCQIFHRRRDRSDGGVCDFSSFGVARPLA